MSSPTAAPSTVAVVSVQRSVRDAVREAMELAEWTLFVPPGSRVALKPNLCWDMPLPGAQTSPWFLDAVIQVMKPHVSDLIVIEAGQITVDADQALQACGLERVLLKHDIPFVNMSKGEFWHVRTDDAAAVLRHVEVPRVLDDCLLVTLPVLKTHATTTITGALKNQWGCLTEMRHNHHLVVDQAITDINVILRPAFSVMDGTVALEGNGPKTGIPRIENLVMASADPVAIDAVAARAMGFDPATIPHLAIAASRGLGSLYEINIVGHPPDDRQQFRPARPGIVTRTEFALRRSRLCKLAFETRFLGFLAYAAKIYNRLWYALIGARERRRILDSRYGPQWMGQDESPSTDDLV